MLRLYLASGSPRRADILRQLGVPFSVLPPPDVDESVLSGESPADYVRRLAVEKARAGVARAKASMLREPGVAVLGADTAVVYQDHILGKPADAGEALETLLLLAGREHRVLSAVSLITVAGVRTELSETRVIFREFDATLARRYIATGEPFDKAGAYGIQGAGAALVENIRGSYTGVVGLPVEATVRLLDWAGIPFWATPPA